MTTQEFKRKVWGYFAKNSRNLPWRATSDPYKILVSEIMLQQTQVDRVIPKYSAWLKQFPTPRALATAPLVSVLTMWQGLGYNRRALALQQAAKIIAEEDFPKEYEKILELPGVGPYTAGAVMAFAFNTPVVMIETNIRTAFIHDFFSDRKEVHDKELLPLIKKTLDQKKPREWYWALMDYGSYLKKNVVNPSRRSAHYARQSRFAGSNRQLRGTILKYVTPKPSTLAALREKLAEVGLKPAVPQLKKTLGALVAEGFIIQRGQRIAIVQ